MAKIFSFPTLHVGKAIYFIFFNMIDFYFIKLTNKNRILLRNAIDTMGMNPYNKNSRWEAAS